ncbi:hypothetical protein VTH82DRAFT_508 [Thermothelomyces myriococcoides]
MKHILALAAFLPAILAQTYYGCYTDIPARALTGSSLIDYENMTIALCETHCTGLDFGIWGVEYGGECYCGDALAQGSFPTFATDCGMPCPGDTATECGGPNRLSLYGASEESPVVTPYPHDPVTETQYAGCWSEVEGGGTRALAGASAFSLSAMTVPACGDYCLNSGFLWFGLEYGAECYCGEELHVNSTSVAEADCNMPCSGDAETACGGSNRLSVYQWV